MGRSSDAMKQRYLNRENANHKADGNAFDQRKGAHIKPKLQAGKRLGPERRVQNINQHACKNDGNNGPQHTTDQCNTGPFNQKQRKYN